MIHTEFEQQSEAWREYKLGRVSGSRLQDILAESRTKGERSTSWRNYISELVVERMTGKSPTHFSSKQMDHGTETEPFARMHYESQNLVSIDQVGFVDHPYIEMAGASPDGLISVNGAIEAKCPNAATHIFDRLLKPSLEARYFAQMQWVIECAEREWCDFISFEPDLPENCRFYCKRYFRDEPFLVNAREKVIEFLSELEDIIAKLRAYHA